MRRGDVLRLGAKTDTENIQYKSTNNVSSCQSRSNSDSLAIAADKYYVNNKSLASFALTNYSICREHMRLYR